ncbi:MAG: hypothetical protein GY778_03770 [bacterium]|nr:hypothetical protein [bacterium]
MFRPRTLSEEVARPVSFADARAFRWATVLHAFVPMVVALVLVYLLEPPQAIQSMDPVQRATQIMMTGSAPDDPTFAERAYAEVWPMGVILICCLLFGAAATGIPSYFFHPRRLSVRQQNAAVALSYYGCAPLALTVLPVISLGASLVAPDTWPMELGAGLAACVMAVVLLIWVVILVRLARRTMPQLGMQPLRVAVFVPLCWLAAAGLTLVGLPVVVLFVLVVVSSLR